MGDGRICDVREEHRFPSCRELSRENPETETTCWEHLSRFLDLRASCIPKHAFGSSFSPNRLGRLIRQLSAQMARESSGPQAQSRTPIPSPVKGLRFTLQPPKDQYGIAVDLKDIRRSTHLTQELAKLFRKDFFNFAENGQL